jgi:hypothetical protein
VSTHRGPRRGGLVHTGRPVCARYDLLRRRCSDPVPKIATHSLFGVAASLLAAQRMRRVTITLRCIAWTVDVVGVSVGEAVGQPQVLANGRCRQGSGSKAVPPPASAGLAGPGPLLRLRIRLTPSLTPMGGSATVTAASVCRTVEGPLHARSNAEHQLSLLRSPLEPVRPATAVCPGGLSSRSRRGAKWHRSFEPIASSGNRRSAAERLTAAAPRSLPRTDNGERGTDNRNKGTDNGDKGSDLPLSASRPLRRGLFRGRRHVEPTADAAAGRRVVQSARVVRRGHSRGTHGVLRG